MDALPICVRPAYRRSRRTARTPAFGSSRRWITLLHRQVIREVLQVFLLTLLVTTGLMILVGVVQQLLSIGATAKLLLQLIPYFVPVMLPFVIPSALLFAVVAVYGRMCADGELTAARAAGVNVLSLLTPSVLLGFALAICTFVLTDRAVPWAGRQIQGAIVTYASDLLIQQLESTGSLANGPGGMQITVVGMDGARMLQPLIRFRAASGQNYSISAAAARFDIDRRRAAVMLELQDATVHILRASGESADHAYLRGTQTIPIPYTPGTTSLKTHHLTTAEIRQRILRQEQLIATRQREQRTAQAADRTVEAAGLAWQLQEAAKTVRYLNTEYHSRFALAYGSFGFALFGSVMSAMQASGRLLANLLFCFMPIVGVYYTLELGIAVQCKSGHLDPAWAMWIGNVLITGMALWLLRSLARR